MVLTGRIVHGAALDLPYGHWPLYANLLTDHLGRYDEAEEQYEDILAQARPPARPQAR